MAIAAQSDPDKLTSLGRNPRLKRIFCYLAEVRLEGAAPAPARSTEAQ